MTDWLLHTQLATSALALLVLIVREPVRTRFGSRVAYGLWLIPVARLFMPTLTQTVERPVPAAPPSLLVADEPLAMAHAATPDPSPLHFAGGWPTVLVALWLGVAAVLFASRMISFCRDRRAILDSSLGVTRLGVIQIVRTDEIASPVALGIFRPIIAIPANFGRMYGKRERRLVLEHELAHHRSGDLVANLFAFVLLCLQWFNPLAWMAHAAFRFDQEAACDARVLDKAAAADRASYGRAIAKAASGRALLFASALDRPTSLQRRLQSMLRSPSPTRRVAGRLLIAAAAVAALPLTASHAIAYVDVPATVAPVAPLAAALPAAAPAAVVAVQAAAAPAPVARPVAPAASARASAPPEFDGELSLNEDRVVIDGKTKRWEDLTPAEKARVSAAVAKAKKALANSHFDQAKVMRDLANLPDPARMAEMQRKLAEMQGKVAESIRKMDANAAKARADGREPDHLEAAIHEKLQALQAVDMSQVSRALAGVDRAKVAAEVAGAQESMEKAKAELDRIQARIDADQRH